MSATQSQIQVQCRFFISCFLQIFLSLSFSVLITPSAAAAANLQFPCNPPHNSYLFCNTTLSTSTRSHSLLSLLTLSEKIKFLSNTFSGIPRLGIPPYQWWSESLHGIAPNGPGVSFNGSIQSATLFPQVLLTAASFSRSLWFEIASAIAVEGRAMYNYGQAGLTFWAPNINIFRDPRWGRGQETPGEDPMVAAAFAVEYVKGFQGDREIGGGGVVGGSRALVDVRDNDDDGGKLMLSACCKHFTAYDLDAWHNFSRYSFNAVVTKQDLEDTYQPPFKSCIHEGKASCLMCSYNSVDGVPACARGDLLQKVRTEWGFQGYITSDCDAVACIFEYHNYTRSKGDAVADALKAGMDINCGTYLLYNTESAVNQGKVQEGDIDRALLNLFNVQLRLGLFDGDPLSGKFGKFGAQDVCTKEHRRLALEAARQGIVLLKNDKKFLPLNKDDVSSLVVIGPRANNTSEIGGDYSGVPCEPTSYVEGLRKYIQNTGFAPGCLDVLCDSDSEFEEAILIAKGADYVVVVIGIDLSQETEDKDRVTLLLPGKQVALVSSVAAVSKRPLVLVVTGGGPVDISFAKEDPKIASILWVGYPGEAGGKALAEIIFGDYNPGGRLPITWYPESFTNVPMNDMNMRADPSHGYPGRTYRFYTGPTVYKFGQGLSYSSYKYKLLSAPRILNLSGLLKSDPSKNILYQSEDETGYILVNELSSCDSLRFSVEISVMNIGDRDGSHIVLLFSKAASVIKGAPEKQLVGFTRVQTRSYKMTETSVLVDPCKHLSFANEQGERILPLGDHILTLEDLEHHLVIQI
ncbi:Probable beta-D-xylosidase 6 [Ancistrocladus abbreviatus]